MAEVAGVDDTPPGEWLDECRDLLPQLTSAIPGRHLPTVRAFLDADPPDPADRLVFTHDLGIEHVLVDPDTGRVTGVLDWGTPPSPTPPTTSAWSCAISGSRPSRPHWPPTGPLPAATEPSGNASTSTPAAPCSRTSPTDWTPAGTPTSRRACSGWPDCSPPDRLDPTTAEGAAVRPRLGQERPIRPSEGTAGQVGRADTSPGHRWAHGLAASRAAEARSTVLSSR